MAVSARPVSLGQRLLKALGSFAPKHSGHQKLGKADELMLAVQIGKSSKFLLPKLMPHELSRIPKRRKLE